MSTSISIRDRCISIISYVRYIGVGRAGSSVSGHPDTRETLEYTIRTRIAAAKPCQAKAQKFYQAKMS